MQCFVIWLICEVAVASGGAFPPRKIAVIGAGIGGGSFSYYWSKSHPEDRIIAFDSRDYVGGRLKHIELRNNIIELGGDAWSTVVNQYVVALAKEMGISLLPKVSSTGQTGVAVEVGDPIKSGMGVWQGDHIEPLMHKVLGHPISDIRAALDEADFIYRLRENYRQRGDHGYFRTIDQFLAWASLNEYTANSSAQYFSMRNPLSRRHISEELLQFALEPLTRVIYDQNLSESHAFASLVAATAAVGAASFQGGNSILVERLFRASKADLQLRTRVTDVTYDEKHRTYTLRHCTDKSPCNDMRVDFVIMACPFEHANISFAPPVHVKPRAWRHWYVTVTRAHGLNPTFFGLAADQVVPFDNVLTTENSSATVPFNVVQLEASLSDGTSLWKLFSNEDPSSKLRQIFRGWSEDPTDTVVQYWPYTFPVLRPIPPHDQDLQYQPIILGPGLLYLNTMESVASAMEGSILAARNAALLLDHEQDPWSSERSFVVL